MSLNGLDGAPITEAYQAALAEAGGWFLLKYLSRDTVDLLAKGTGGVVEVRGEVEQYEEKSPLYGLVQYRRRKVILKYVPEGTSRLLKARLSVQFQSVLEKLSPHDTVFDFTEAVELTEPALSSACILHASIGSLTSSASSLHRRRLGEITEDTEEGQKIERPASGLRYSVLSNEEDSHEDEKIDQENNQETSIEPAPANLAPDRPFPVRNSSLGPFHSRPSSPLPTYDKSLPSLPSQSEDTASHKDTKLALEEEENAEEEVIRTSLDPRRSSPPGYRPYKPKIKLGPRPSAQRPLGSGSVRPVANLPASVRISNRRPLTPSRPTSADSSRPISPPSSRSALTPFPTHRNRLSNTQPSHPSVHISSLYQPVGNPDSTRPTSPAFSVSSTDTRHSLNSVNSKLTPEKARLMRALQLRKQKTHDSIAERSEPESSNSNISTRPNSMVPGAGFDLPKEADMDQQESKDARGPTPQDVGSEQIPKPLDQKQHETVRDENNGADEPPQAESEDMSETRKQTKPLQADTDPVAEPPSIKRQIHVKSPEERDGDTALSSTNGSESSSSQPSSPDVDDSPTDEPSLPQTRYIPSNSESPVLPKEDLKRAQESYTKENGSLKAAETPILGATVPLGGSEHILLIRANAEQLESMAVAAMPLSTVTEESCPSEADIQVIGTTVGVAQNQVARSPISTSKRRPSQSGKGMEMPEASPTTDNMSDQSEDEALYAEIQEATVEEAKPMIVSRSPINSIINKVSPEQSRSFSVASRMTQDSVKSTPEKAKPAAKRSSSGALPQWPPAAGSILQISSRKTSVSSNISQRIKALEAVSGRNENGTSPPSTARGPSSPISAGFINARISSNSPDASVNPRVHRRITTPTQRLSASSPESTPNVTPVNNKTRAPLSPKKTANIIVSTTKEEQKPVSATNHIFLKHIESKAEENQPTSTTASSRPKSPVSFRPKSPLASSPMNISFLRLQSTSSTHLKDDPTFPSQPHMTEVKLSTEVVHFREPNFKKLEVEPLAAEISKPEERHASEASQSAESSRLAESEPFSNCINVARRHMKNEPTEPSRAESDSSSVDDEKRTKDSRKARLMRRMSLLTAGSRRSLASAFGSTNHRQESQSAGLRPPKSIAENTESSSDLSSIDLQCETVEIGDVNIQFPDTLLWKQRFMRIDDLGYLILTPPTMAPNRRGISRHFHLSEFKRPFIPPIEQEELPWSIMLDFHDGRSLQCACESAYAQTQVLKLLIDAHSTYQDFVQV